MSFDWRGIIRTVAPTLATAVTGGNPLAGMAIGAISKALLGRPDGTEQDIIDLMAGATPETLAKLKEVETDFKIKMEELGVKVHELDVQDRGSARAKEIATGDVTPKVLAGAYTLGYFILLGSVMMWGIPADGGAGQVITALIGALTAIQLQIANYYFGSSKGSSDKTKMLTKLTR